MVHLYAAARCRLSTVRMPTPGCDAGGRQRRLRAATAPFSIRWRGSVKTDERLRQHRVPALPSCSGAGILLATTNVRLLPATFAAAAYRASTAHLRCNRVKLVLRHGRDSVAELWSRGVLLQRLPPPPRRFITLLLHVCSCTASPCLPTARTCPGMVLLVCWAHGWHGVTAQRGVRSTRGELALGVNGWLVATLANDVVRR